MPRESNDEIRTTLHALEAHLAWWGLRQFTSDESYFQWQRETLSSEDLTTLHRQVEQKRRGSAVDEIAFYDATAHPNILPVLYSQRYDYCLAIGPRVADRIGEARSILDVGCGVGILTTFYARQHPDKTFVGIDRSPVSIERAQERAQELGLTNVRFDWRCCPAWAMRPPWCRLNRTLVFPVAVGTPSSVSERDSSRQILRGERESA